MKTSISKRKAWEFFKKIFSKCLWIGVIVAFNMWFTTVVKLTLPVIWKNLIVEIYNDKWMHWTVKSGTLVMFSIFFIGSIIALLIVWLYSTVEVLEVIGGKKYGRMIL